jgi:hypothetical protein
MQVLWVHEAIQDAGELWWRACAELEPPDYVTSVAHDEEQRMVARLMEHPGSCGCISDQIWRRRHSKQVGCPAGSHCV